MVSYDIVGTIAILKFQEDEQLLKKVGKTKNKEKKKIAEKLLKEHKNIRTVLEKIEKVKGRLRTYKTRYLAGINTKETIHIESGCKFKLDIEKCYFSPRLSGERLEIAKKIKKKDNVLVMFAGVAPYSIVIAKKSGAKVVSVELNKLASKYAKENVKLNKLKNLKVVQGDVKRIIPKLKEKFDVIVMPRPQLKDSFLKQAFLASKKGTRIFYYDFGKDSENKKFSDSQTSKKKQEVSDVSGILERVYKESRKAGKKIIVEKVKKAGEIAPYKFRWRVEFKVV